MSWPKVKLEDLVEINPSVGTVKEDWVSFVPMQSVSELEKRIVEIQTRPFAEVAKGYTSFRNGDLLLAKITPCFENGKQAIVDIPTAVGYGSSEFHVFRKKEERIDIKFLHYFFQQPSFRHVAAINMTGTAGQKRVPAGFLSRQEIPLPPLPIQKKIAAVLEKADELRRKREEQIKRLDDLLQATFLDMFGDPVTNPKGWKIASLGDVTKKVTSGATPKGGQSSYLDEGILFIRSQNVLMQDLDLSNVAYIGSDVHEAMKRSTLSCRDVLLNITGASIGRVCVYESSKEANVNQHVCLIRCNLAAINPFFLSYQFGSANFQHKYISMNAGATREAFNYEEIKCFKLMLPPLAVQNGFEAFVKNTTCLRLKMKRIQTDNLFNSLMQKAFQGELDLK